MRLLEVIGTAYNLSPPFADIMDKWFPVNPGENIVIVPIQGDCAARGCFENWGLEQIRYFR